MTDSGWGAWNGSNSLAHPPVKPERSGTGWMTISDTGLTDVVVWNRLPGLDTLVASSGFIQWKFRGQISCGIDCNIDADAGIGTNDV